jgi:hypothetical protein
MAGRIGGFGLDGVYVAFDWQQFRTVCGGEPFDQAHGWTCNCPHIGDVNGDGKDDLVGFGFDGVYIALSTGSGFGAVQMDKRL